MYMVLCFSGVNGPQKLHILHSFILSKLKCWAFSMLSFAHANSNLSFFFINALWIKYNVDYFRSIYFLFNQNSDSSINMLYCRVQFIWCMFQCVQDSSEVKVESRFYQQLQKKHDNLERSLHSQNQELTVLKRNLRDNQHYPHFVEKLKNLQVIIKKNHWRKNVHQINIG